MYDLFSMKAFQFEKDFLWGTSTAGHQIEGNNIYSNNWADEQKRPVDKTGIYKPSGMACDHWNRIDEDIELMKQIGASAYRMSIEWSRIEPEEGRFDGKAIDHYLSELTKLKESGFTVFVTLHHFTYPLWFDKKGGFVNLDNRTYFETVLYNQPDYIEWCFKTAETYFPANQLVVNEWTGLPWSDHCRTSDKYYSYIEANLLKGARIDAIGMQFHMFYSKEDEYRQTRPYYDPRNLYAHMDLYSNFAKPLQVTEVTIPAYSNDPEDAAIQAELIEYLYSVWFSHPNMEQIIYWNLVDGYAAFAKQGDMTQGENYYYGGLLRFDMTPKPAYYTIKNLIEKKWHTEETIITDDSGTAGFRGFYGMYELELTVDKKVIRKEICLRKNGNNQFEISC